MGRPTERVATAAFFALVLYTCLALPDATARAAEGVTFDASRREGVYATIPLPSGSSHRVYQAACEADEECAAWTFARERGSRDGIDLNLGSRFRITLGGGDRAAPAQCHLSNSAGRARSDNCCITGVRLAAVGEGGRAEQRCAAYADRAVAQQEANLDRNCGLKGQHWNANFDRHQNWCTKVGAERAADQENQRIEELRECEHSEASLGRECQRYAQTAVSQVEFNKQNRCGFAGGDWHGQSARYYRACMLARASFVEDELADREAALGRCIVENDSGRTTRRTARKDERAARRPVRGGAYFEMPQVWSKGFGAASGWSLANHPRYLTDVNGDGRDDIVGFADGGAYVARSNGEGFEELELVVPSFGAATGGWQSALHPRMLGDIDGDGAADIVGFAGSGVFVSFNRRSRFTDPVKLVSQFGVDGGWSVAQHLRAIADVNGDGRGDIVGFADGGVYVALSRGRRIDAATEWSKAFGAAGGWSIQHHPRFLIDVDGDRMQDIVGLADDGAYVALSTGKSFEAPEKWVGIDADARGKGLGDHPRFMADVNGDRLPDLVAFNAGGVLVALNDRGRGFSRPVRWTGGFTSRQGGWGASHVRNVVDIDGDGRADLVGIADQGVTYALSTGETFGEPAADIKAFGAAAGGWNSAQHLRLFADVDGDDRLDIVGFADNGVSVALARH